MGLGVIVLAAGLGTRMRSRLPKVLHRVAGRSLLEHVLGAALPLAPERTVIVVGRRTEGAIRESLERWDATFVVQDPPQGTAHAAEVGLGALGDRIDEVLVLVGDAALLRPESLRALLELRRREGAAVAVLTGQVEDPRGYGRILRDDRGEVRAIVEEREASPEERRVREVNSGVLAFDRTFLEGILPRIPLRPEKGERYLTDAVALALAAGQRVVAHRAEDPTEVLGVNTRADLARTEALWQRRLRARWLEAGVTMRDPESVYLEVDVELAPDVVLEPQVHLRGRTVVGEGCRIGPFAVVADSVLGPGCRVFASVLEGARLGPNVDVGPFSHLRPGAVLEEGVHIGNFAEVKNSRLGRGVKMGHVSYVGDAEVGEETNIGAGTITCNYDGVRKHRTVIGPRAFIGSDTMLVAPVRIGAGARTGAGAVVTRDVPDGETWVGVPARPLRRKGEEEDRA